MYKSVNSINSRIKKEVCRDIISQLSDESLIDEYKKSKSTIREVEKLTTILRDYVDLETSNKIIDRYLINLIPPGTKGVIRGNKFNSIVRSRIFNMNLDSKRFNIQVETQHPTYIMSEIPDWYIYDNHTSSILIGMNQIDLWSEGQQLNRGSKYILDRKNINKNKLLCVVCNETIVNRDRGKVYNIFKTGFENDTLCYVGNLESLIKKYFQI